MSTVFPDEFPFNRRHDEALVEAIVPQEPVRQTALPNEVFSSFEIRQPRKAAPLPELRITPPPLGTERRRAARQTLVARATIKSESNFRSGPMAAGYVSNISMKGVGFHTRRPLLVGESYQMKLEAGPLKWQSRVRIVNCKEHDSGTYDVGAEFIANELVRAAIAA
jgi:PilZ domain-containing protein